MKLEWETVDAEADWPEDRYRATTEKYVYRILRDPDGENVMFPPDVRGEWWGLLVQALNDSTYVHATANPRLDWAKRDAEHWE